jgi:hypothetical protein
MGFSLDAASVMGAVLLEQNVCFDFAPDLWSNAFDFALKFLGIFVRTVFNDCRRNFWSNAR